MSSTVVPAPVHPVTVDVPATRRITGRLVALALCAGAVAAFVLSTGDRVLAADVVRLVLLVGWAVAGAAVVEVDATRRLGVIILAGAGTGVLRSVSHGLLERGELKSAADLVLPLASALVVAIGVHLIVAVPDGQLRSPSSRSIVAAVYAAAVVVGAINHGGGVPGWQLVVLGAVGAAAAVPVAHRRYRDARGVVRQRMQWLGLAAALVVETVIIVAALDVLLSWPPKPLVVIGGSLLLLAVAFVAGSSRRLVGQVETLLQHAVTLAGSSAIVVLTYLVVVIGLGRVPTDEERTVLVLSMLAAAIATIVFLPARTRLAEAANRIVYGEANDPTEALETFGQRMTRALPMDELLLQLVELLKKHLALAQAEVWSGTDGRFERAASVPDRGVATLVLGDKELPVVARAGVSGQRLGVGVAAGAARGPGRRAGAHRPR